MKPTTHIEFMRAFVAMAPEKAWRPWRWNSFANFAILAAVRGNILGYEGECQRLSRLGVFT